MVACTGSYFAVTESIHRSPPPALSLCVCVCVSLSLSLPLCSPLSALCWAGGSKVHENGDGKPAGGPAAEDRKLKRMLPASLLSGGVGNHVPVPARVRIVVGCLSRHHCHTVFLLKAYQCRDSPRVRCGLETFAVVVHNPSIFKVASSLGVLSSVMLLLLLLLFEFVLPRPMLSLLIRSHITPLGPLEVARMEVDLGVGGHPTSSSEVALLRT